MGEVGDCEDLEKDGVKEPLLGHAYLGYSHHDFGVHGSIVGLKCAIQIGHGFLFTQFS